jgi:hypothetical protein
MPVRELHKKDGERCRHEVANGCGVYRRPDLMPRSCRMWNCRWLVEDDTADQIRPDLSHLVIDILPDFVAVIDNDTGEQSPVEVVQVWCDPAHRDAHRDPVFREYVARQAARGKATIVRFSSAEAVTLFAPAISADNEWHEVGGQIESADEHDRRGVELQWPLSKKK